MLLTLNGVRLQRKKFHCVVYTLFKTTQNFCHQLFSGNGGGTEWFLQNLNYSYQQK